MSQYPRLQHVPTRANQQPRRSWWAPPAAPSLEPPSPPVDAPRQQRRNARGRFVRAEDGPRTVRDPRTGCELWTGPMRGGTPYDGKRSVLASRYEARVGEPLPPKYRLIRACHNQRCVDLAHVVVLAPEDALLYSFVAKEPRLLTQAEVDAAVEAVSALAQQLGISLTGLASYLRRPIGLAELFADAPEPARG